MSRLTLCLFITLGIYLQNIDFIQEASSHSVSYILQQKSEQSITPMEALDMVKERNADNFDKVYAENAEDFYYYKSAIADYYLVYEGEVGTKGDYLIHLYEFVLDEPETGIGHTVTYGWYQVNRENGVISEHIN